MKRISDYPDEVSPAFALLQLSEKDMHKHVLVEELPFQLESYLREGLIDYSAKTRLIVYFNPEAGLMKPQIHLQTVQQEKEALIL
jgi:hypothetical protein